MIYHIKDLIPTQNRLRYLPKPSAFIGPVPIALTQTEDDLLYIWNGHHRLFSLWQAGVRGLPPDKVNIAHMTYAQLGSINFDKGYVTPFDPRKECRLEDFVAYKAEVIKRYQTYNYDQAIRYITSYTHKFRELREVRHIKDLYIH